MKNTQLVVFIACQIVSGAAFAQENQLLEEIVVQGEYLSIDEANSIKTPTPIINVPQSLSILTAEQIRARGIDSIGDIIDYTAGVNTSQGEGHRDAVVFRGVRSTADFFIDGNRDDVQYFRSLYNIEQVEILRGPNALLFGRGGTGGVLNRVTKKAETGEVFTTYKGAVNTFGGYGVELDYNTSSSDTFAFRINASYENLDNHRDFFDGDRIGFNPTARFLVGDDTIIDLSYEYVDHERFIDRGIPTGADGRPVQAFEDILFVDPEVNLTGLEAHLLRASLQRSISNSTKLNASVFFGDYDKFYQNFFAAGYDQANSPQQVTLDGYVDETDRQNLIISANLVSELQIGDTDHTLVYGVEYIDTSSDQFRFNPVFSSNNDDQEQFSVARPINLRGGAGVNADGQAITYSFSDLNDDTRVGIDIYSLYIQDQIAFSENFDVVLGVRYDSFDIDVDNVEANEVRSRKDSEISPRLGLIYKPAENASIYLSYSESFLPRSGEQFTNINGDNNRLDPDTYSNTEIGVKWDFENGISLTAAAFENEQERPVVSDADASTFDIQEAEVSGFEIQLNGPITDIWHISASYTNLDGETASGGTPREIPDNMFSMWNRFQVADNFGLGVGVTYQDESFINNSNSAALPSYTRVDASAYYDVSEKMRVQVNVENLFDELYFPNAHSTHQATVGGSANATVSLIGSF